MLTHIVPTSLRNYRQNNRYAERARSRLVLRDLLRPTNAMNTVAPSKLMRLHV